MSSLNSRYKDVCKIRNIQKANRKPVGNFRWKREIVVKKKKKPSCFWVQGRLCCSSRVCVCVREKGDRERDRHKTEDGETDIHAYSCSIPNPKFLPTLHTSGKPGA